MKPGEADPGLRSALRRLGAEPPELIELFDYVEDLLVWLKDAAGHYQWVNVPFLLNVSVPSRAEIIGRTDFDLCGDDMANQYRIDDERVLQGERIVSRVELVGRFNHTARWCVTSKIPVHDARGRIVGTVGVTRPLDQNSLVAPGDSPLSAAIRHVSQHYHETVTNRQLAKASGLSQRTGCATRRMRRTVAGVLCACGLDPTGGDARATWQRRPRPCPGKA